MAPQPETPRTHLVNGPVPKHTQLRSILLDLVDNSLSVDAPIPSERELMTTYGVSRATVREAIGQLVNENRLYRIHGKGTFVAGQRVESRLHLASFTDDMRRRGLDPATIVRAVAKVEAPAAAQAALRLPEGAQVWRIDRLRLAGGDPMALEIGHYSLALLPDLDRHDLSASLYTTLASSYDLRIDHAEQTVWATLADHTTAGPLGIAQGGPLMVFRRTSSAGGVPVEYVTSWYRGDRYQVHMSLDSTT